MNLRAGLSRGALLLGGLAFGLLLAEGGVRALGYDPLDDPQRFQAGTEWNEDCTEPAAGGVGYRYRPGACGTNALGMPDAERPVAPPVDELRVLVLGDSISADRLYVGFAEALLAERTGRPVDVLNTGVPGYATTNEVAAFAGWADRLDPHAVVLQFCLNDYGTTPVLVRDGDRLVRAEDRGDSLRTRSLFWFTRSALYRSVAMRIAQTAEPPRLEERFAPVEAELARLADAAAARGLPLVVQIWPYLDAQTAWPGVKQKAYQRIVPALTEMEIPAIDLTPIFLSGDVEALRRSAAAQVHAAIAEEGPRWGLQDADIAHLADATAAELGFRGGGSGSADRIHPNFLGHWLAARALVEHLLPRMEGASG